MSTQNKRIRYDHLLRQQAVMFVAKNLPFSKREPLREKLIAALVAETPGRERDELEMMSRSFERVARDKKNNW
ncbi:MAG: hypothetical protein PHV13_04455, partial [Candidatus ainarchaeum sp.]|nr:hypothetical protein [Candidatus ainarchaeum sp.]